MKNEAFVEIDLSKARLDAALRLGGEGFAVTIIIINVALRALIKGLKKLCVSGIVLEASGGYQIGPAADLALAGLPVAVVNPSHVRNFARATVLLTKTVAIDARVSHFAKVI